LEQRIKELEIQRAVIKEKLDRRTISCLIKSNKFFVNYDKDWSVIWYINKFIRTWKPEGNKVSDTMLDEMYEETQDDLFLNLKEYREIGKRIKKLKGNKGNKGSKGSEGDKVQVKFNKFDKTSNPIIDSIDEIEEVYLFE